MAVRRFGEILRFDHGAQYFTARDERFQEIVAHWCETGCAALWSGKLVTLSPNGMERKDDTTQRYVGVPGMNACCKRLAEGLDIRFRTRVTSTDFRSGRWRLNGEGSELIAECERLIVTAPAPQAAELMPTESFLHDRIRRVALDPCWAAMVAFDVRLPLDFDGAFVNDAPLSWIARNGSKPGRPSAPEAWTLHASPHWSRANVDRSAEEILTKLLESFWQVTQAPPREPSHAAAHRWRYSISPQPLDERFLVDSALNLGVCGDWCGGPRVEGAFLSGSELAERLLAAD